MTKTLNKVKIHEALDLLSSAAADEQAELRDMINGGYGSLKEFLGSFGNGAKRGMAGFYKAAKKTARTTASGVDTHVHANTWIYVAGGVALSLLAGYFIARRRQ